MRSLDEANTILSEWQPHLAVIDMDHDDSTALLGRVGASNTLTRSVTPVLGLTRRGDLRTKLRAPAIGSCQVRSKPADWPSSRSSNPRRTTTTTG